MREEWDNHAIESTCPDGTESHFLYGAHQERKREREKIGTSVLRSSMDHEESNERRNGDDRNRQRRYLGIEFIENRRAKHSHDLEAGSNYEIVPEKYGKIYVLDHLEMDVFCTFIKVSSSSKCVRDQSLSFFPYWNSIDYLYSFHWYAKELMPWLIRSNIYTNPQAQKILAPLERKADC